MTNASAIRGILAASVLLLSGCYQVGAVVKHAAGTAKQDLMRQDLKEFGLAYHAYMDAHGRGAQNWNDIESVASSEGIRRLRNSGLNVRWGIHVRDAKIGSSNYILAFEKDALRSGGLILYLDGSVRHMQAEQLAFAIDLREGRLGREYAQDIFYFDEDAQAALRAAKARAERDASDTAAPATASPSRTSSGGERDIAGAASTPVPGRIEQRQPSASTPSPSTDAGSHESSSSFGGSGNAQGSPATSPSIANDPPLVRAQPTPLPSAIVRVWTEATGQSRVEAELLRVEDENVHLRRTSDGRTFQVALSRLSAADREFLAGLTGASGSQARRPLITELLGGPGGGTFRELGSSPMIGVSYSDGSYADQDAVSRLRPIWDRDDRAGQKVVVAQPGYVLGAMDVDADRYVNAIRLVFMRQQPDGSVDPSDSYTSDWLGKPSGRRTRRLAGNGQPVYGLYGRQMIIVDAIGLLLAPG